MAENRVARRLHRVTAALDAANVPYAVVGGNAVAAWVGRANPSAVRATKDVDLLAQRSDLDRLSKVMEDLGFERNDLRRLVLFLDPEEPDRRSGVHLVWADERVRPSYAHPAPSVDEAVRDPEGFRVLDLLPLVRMKLTSFRDIDRVHVADMIDVGLIDNLVIGALPPDLQTRLKSIKDSMEDLD